MFVLDGVRVPDAKIGSKLGGSVLRGECASYLACSPADREEVCVCVCVYVSCVSTQETASDQYGCEGNTWLHPSPLVPSLFSSPALWPADSLPVIPLPPLSPLSAARPSSALLSPLSGGCEDGG